MSQKASKLIINITDSAKELFVIYISVITTAAFLYSFLEHKHLFDAFWWAFVTAMTVGYGDTYPLTLGGRVVAIALMHVVPLFVIPLITARLAAKLTVDSNAFTNQEQEEIKEGIQEIRKLLKENNK